MKKYLQYTETEYLEAVKQNGYALQYVKDQTENICLEAVRENPDALEYVERYYESIAKIVTDEEYLSLGTINNDKEAIELNGKKYKLIK